MNIAAVARTASRAATRPLWWSYRLKIPLALTAVALLAGVSVATTTYLLVYRHVEANAASQTQALARTLARSLVQPVLSNDIWQAFQTVRASAPEPRELPGPPLQIVVIDAQSHVVVALDPQAYSLGLPATRLSAPLADAARWIVADTGSDDYSRADDARDSLVVAERIKGEEDTLLGGVIVQQERGISRAQARAVAVRLTALGMAAIALVAVLGWIGGRRMIRPLETLRAAMHVAPGDDVRPVVAQVSRRNDEVGDLGAAFLSMMDEIDAKRLLEREMLNAERMASIGRLTAGIAHEVNNPLGGMLSAIQNRRLRGGVDDATERTLALLERGLAQIHGTVNALLNEARHELHTLREDDLHDLHVLLHPEAEHLQCALDWWPALPPDAHLPSVPVRQVLLNLTLNAIAAAGVAGRVRVTAGAAAGRWEVRVANTGATLDAGELERLLQGHPRSDDGRTGFGLWITARILHTLGGTLGLAPPADGRAFSTELVATFPLHTA